MSSYLDSTGKPFHGVPQRILPAVGAAIFNERGHILLEKRSDFGLWGLPGGAIEIGESVRDATVREVLEETGLDVIVKRLVGIYSDPQSYAIARYPDGNSVHFVSILFECERQSGELTVSHESTDLAYFDPHDLPEAIMPRHAISIQDAVAATGQPFIR